MHRSNHRRRGCYNNDENYYGLSHFLQVTVILIPDTHNLIRFQGWLPFNYRQTLRWVASVTSGRMQGDPLQRNFYVLMQREQPRPRSTARQ
jgi:hypothetical protein